MPTETATTITMPQLGESVTEGTIGSWLKEVGDRIDKYEPLVEVETDKANAEIPAPAAGVLVEILVEPGTTVAVGTDLCRIEEPEAAGAAPAPETTGGDDTGSAGGGGGVLPVAPVPPSTIGRKGEITNEMELLRARSSPVVRRIAEEHGVNIAGVEGTGIGGRVTKRDLLAHLAQPLTPAAGQAAVGDEGPTPATATQAREEAATEPVPAAVPTREPASALQSEARPAPTRAPVPVFPGDEVIPVTPMRRMIAEHMVRSQRTAPHATVVMEVDMTNAVAYRAARKEEFRRREGVELTYLPMVMKAATLALRDHPRLNAVWDEDRIIHRKAINIGVAVALEDGLVVPVVRNADRLSLAGLMHAVAELAGKARTGTLAPDDVAGGTFTVNNPGTFGSLVSTPILVQPQVAILSTEAIVKRPVVIDDMIGIRSMMNLSLSIDHRVLDGLAATRFLQQVKRWLEAANDDLALY
ncbi:MAG TPA: 2-oxo acid dehydrogenase subunit E2 [Thermomicrobiales bacterium]|nr:2-oxo acid dehydrogenase subunit E2 [Thermomicrobiales bacterium]